MTAKQFNLLIGTYTTSVGDDIAVYRFDVESGAFLHLGGINDIENPSYLCLSRNGRFVYAVNEVGGDRYGKVTALSFEPQSGELKHINQQSVTGKGPCYVSVDSEQTHLFVANYGSGSLSVLPLAGDGSLLPVIQTIENKGSGPDKQRQEEPHVHAAILSPDEKYLLFTDLGTDKLHFYHYQPLDARPLSAADPSSLTVRGGQGPRHLRFTPDKKFMYLITEMGGYIYGYAYNGPWSRQLQTISLVAEGFKGAVGGGDLCVSPDGHFLYASNRGDANEIVVFSINAETGWLTFIERKPSMGKGPRNLSIDPCGNYLLVANENSNDVFTYLIDKRGGTLTLTDSKLDIGRPACLKFAGMFQ